MAVAFVTNIVVGSIMTIVSLYLLGRLLHKGYNTFYEEDGKKKRNIWHFMLVYLLLLNLAFVWFSQFMRGVEL